MKLNKILTTAAVAIAASVSANAGTYTQGDLILGIYDSSNTSSPALEFNLGAYSKYASGGAQGFVLNIGAEMTSVFGADWATNSNLQWGLASLIQSNLLNSRLAFGIAETTFGTINTELLPNLSNASVAKNAVSVYGSTYSTATTVEGDGYKISQGTTGNISSYNDKPTYVDFNTYADIIVPLSSHADSNGNMAFDLFYYAGSAAATYQNTFTISNTGEIQAVPEPSTYAMMAVGGLGLLRMFRRRSLLKA